MDWCLAEKSDGSSAQEDVTLQMNTHTMFINKRFSVLKPFLFCKYWSFLVKLVDILNLWKHHEIQLGGYLELIVKFWTRYTISKFSYHSANTLAVTRGRKRVIPYPTHMRQ